MRWLIIALLVSLVVLLVAAMGLVRHIWLQRHTQAPVEPGPAAPAGKETDPEP